MTDAVPAPRLVALDSETSLILPGLAAPPAVLGSWFGDGVGMGALPAPDFYDRVRDFLDSDAVLVFANAPFDLAVFASDRPELLPLIFRALRERRVHDVLTAQALDAVYRGTLGFDPRTGGPLVKPSTGQETKRYSLEVVCDLVLGRVDAKKRDHFRMSYELFRGVSIDRLPDDAREYVFDDVKNPYDVARVQIFGQAGTHGWDSVPKLPGTLRNLARCRFCDVVYDESEPGHGTLYASRCPKAPSLPPHGNLLNLSAQVEAAVCLYFGSCWSLRTDPEKVEALAAEVEEKHAQAVLRFQSNGWVRENGTEDQAAVKRAVARAYGASGQCSRCGGTGEVRPRKSKPCRGQKLRGRYQECGGAGCAVCGGEGKIYYAGDTVVCKAGYGDPTCEECGEVQFAHPNGGVTCPRDHRANSFNHTSGCDGTGLDLRTAPSVRRTPSGGVSTSRDTLLESGDDDLAAYGQNEYEKIRTTQIPWLRTGIDRPLSYGVNAVLASGRISLEGSPAHQMTREGGERECIRARGAWCGHPVEMVLGSSDFGAGELCALGQYTKWLFGHSEMLRFINETGDPGVLHSVLGAEVLGITLDEFLRRKKEKAISLVRQSMKPISFGKPACMGSPKIVLTSRDKKNGFTVCEAGPARQNNKDGGEDRGYWGVRFCITVGGAKSCGAEKIVRWGKQDIAPVCKSCVEIVEHVLTPAYFKRFPEIEEYHAWGKKAVKKGAALSQSVLWSESDNRPVVIRERLVPGGELSTWLNNPFQSMVADLTTIAYVTATRECYLGVKDDGSPSPLAGCRLPLFVHDELVSELILSQSHEAGLRITEIMESTGTKYAPDCKAWRADTALGFWFSKGMEPKFKNGMLVPWDQDKMDAWVARHPEFRRAA